VEAASAASNVAASRPRHRPACLLFLMFAFTNDASSIAHANLGSHDEFLRPIPQTCQTELPEILSETWPQFRNPAARSASG
jgi:hypothetical protein